MNYAANTRIAELAAVASAASGGSLVIYSGTQPTTPDTAISGNTALATIVLPAPAFGAATGTGTSSTMTANAISNVNVSNTGTAVWARLYSSAGVSQANTVADFTVGTTGTDLIISSTSITSGTAVSVTSLTLTQPM